MGYLMNLNAPWPQDIVDHLNEYQNVGWFHPFTCANDSNHRNLVATVYGWGCPDCDYVQIWTIVPPVLPTVKQAPWLTGLKDVIPCAYCQAHPEAYV